MPREANGTLGSAFGSVGSCSGTIGFFRPPFWPLNRRIAELKGRATF